MVWWIKRWYLVAIPYCVCLCRQSLYVCECVCMFFLLHNIANTTGHVIANAESRSKLNKQSGLLLMWLIQFSFSIKINIWSYAYYELVWCGASERERDIVSVRMFIVRVRDLSAQLNKWYAFCLVGQNLLPTHSEYYPSSLRLIQTMRLAKNFVTLMQHLINLLVVA